MSTRSKQSRETEREGPCRYNIVEETINISDGDTVTSKSVYSIEANYELKNQVNSKRHYISLGGVNIAKTTNEGMECLYNLTMSLTQDESKFTDPEF